MKIDGLLPPSSNQRLDSAKSRRKGAAAKTATGADSDVELTGISSRLLELETYLAGLGGIDTGKVEAMRQAIAEGRYGFDEDLVAERLALDIVEDLRRRSNK